MPVARRASAVAADRLAELATRHRMTVICGSLESEGDAVYNVAHLATPDGRRFHYRKTHLPFLGVDRFTTPGGDAPSVIDIDGVRVGVLICYDLRFPEAARICGLDGADLIALPTNWPVGVEFHPGLFAPARAAENHCYVLAADRVGTKRGTTFLGRSLLVDFDGFRMAVASDTEEELLVGEIDVDAARATHVRARPGEHEWDTIADRRPGSTTACCVPASTASIRPAAASTPGTWSSRSSVGDGPHHDSGPDHAGHQADERGEPLRAIPVHVGDEVLDEGQADRHVGEPQDGGDRGDDAASSAIGDHADALRQIRVRLGCAVSILASPLRRPRPGAAEQGRGGRGRHRRRRAGPGSWLRRRARG